MAILDKIEYLNTVYDIQDSVAQTAAANALSAAQSASSAASAASTAAANAMAEAQIKAYPKSSKTFNETIALEWNTEYYGTMSGTTTLTVPAVGTSHSEEIRVCFYTSGARTLNINTLDYGASDISVDGAGYYELSIANINGKKCAVMKKWE